jgi:hypothetical protein
MSSDADHPSLRPRRRSRWLLAGGLVLVVVGVLAVSVFEVQTLFTDDAVTEAAPTFASGADADEAAATSSSTSPSPSTTGGPAATAPPTTAAPAVETVGEGTFEGRVHPGEGSVVLLSDGSQTFVRFEEDFATDNGPDLYAVAIVGGERVELGRLKGNRGSQNYELPMEVDPGSVEVVQVWCKRFDVTFTEAAIS